MISRKEQNQNKIISLIEQWHKSGKNKSEFCKKKNICKSTFYYWLKTYDNNLIKKVITAEGFTKY